MHMSIGTLFGGKETGRQGFLVHGAARSLYNLAQRPGGPAARRPGGPAARLDSSQTDPCLGQTRARRLSLLLPVLALLAGMLSLFAAAPVAAQSSSSDELTLLTAMLTVDADGDFLGCDDDVDAQNDHCDVAMTTDNFTLHGTTYSIAGALINRTSKSRLQIRFGEAFDGDIFSRLTLHIDGWPHSPLETLRIKSVLLRSYNGAM